VQAVRKANLAPEHREDQQANGREGKDEAHEKYGGIF
jgi:hypothetical protein